MVKTRFSSLARNPFDGKRVLLVQIFDRRSAAGISMPTGYLPLDRAPKIVI